MSEGHKYSLKREMMQKKNGLAAKKMPPACGQRSQAALLAGQGLFGSVIFAANNLIFRFFL